MAVDTATKRKSVQCYGSALQLPVPDSTVAEGDRAMVVRLYQGMDYSAPVAPPERVIPSPLLTLRMLLGY